MRDGARCTVPPAGFHPYAANQPASDRRAWRKTLVGDYPLQRTITLHSPGAFHMLQLRSYKYLDQTSAESKALATEAFHTHTGAIRYLQGKDDLQPDGKAVRRRRSTGGS